MTSLAGQWLRFYAFIAWGTGSILGQGTKISHAVQCGQEKKSKANTTKYYWTKLDSKSFIGIHLCFILETFKNTKRHNIIV